LRIAFVISRHAETKRLLISDNRSTWRWRQSKSLVANKHSDDSNCHSSATGRDDQDTGVVSCGWSRVQDRADSESDRRVRLVGQIREVAVEDSWSNRSDLKSVKFATRSRVRFLVTGAAGSLDRLCRQIARFHPIESWDLKL